MADTVLIVCAGRTRWNVEVIRGVVPLRGTARTNSALNRGRGIEPPQDAGSGEPVAPRR